MITVNELFSGIGAFRKALMRTNIPHSVVGISEIDQNAINSYNTIYGDTRNYGDIAKIEKLAYLDWADLEKMKDFEAGYSFGGYIDKSPIYRTITASYGKITGNSGKFFRNHRVSCLTPKECWRLMGFDDEDYLKAEKVCDYKQLYKQAGNSIVVTILESLMTNLLSCEPEEPVVSQEQTRSQWFDELLGGI